MTKSERITSQADSDRIEEYSLGSCHYFAIALSRRTGWKIAAIVNPDRRFDEDSEFPEVAHVVTVAPDGMLWDIRGCQTFEEATWEYPDILNPSLLEFDNENDLIIGWCGEDDEFPLYAVNDIDLEEGDKAINEAFPERFPEIASPRIP